MFNGTVKTFAIPIVVFAAAVGLATAIGAKNLGTAAAIAEIFFVAALAWVLLKR